MEAPTSGTEKKVYELEFDYRLVLRVAASSEAEAVGLGCKHKNTLEDFIQGDFLPSLTYYRWKRYGEPPRDCRRPITPERTWI